jgi:hypothetical protein
MINSYDFNIGEDIISKIGLQLSHKPVNAQNAPNIRVFEYPCLENVFVMESDLYGNVMPKNYCFLAFYGRHGLIGTDLMIETLKNASLKDIENMVENNSQC